MNKIARFVIWICKHFTKSEIEQIIKELSDILANRNPEVKPKDDSEFNSEHPHFHNYPVDPIPPLPLPPKPTITLNWKELLAEYKRKNNQELKSA